MRGTVSSMGLVVSLLSLGLFSGACSESPDTCGDGRCEATESHQSCPADCEPAVALCGDGACDASESPADCPEDCGTCSNRCSDDAGGVYFCDGSVDAFMSCPAELYSGCAAADGGEFWCDCGTVGPEGACLDPAEYGEGFAVCEGGFLGFYQCPAGSVCGPDYAGGVVCACDDLYDGICPDAVCVADPDCQSCTPDCTGRECGSDGCGGTCGSCGYGETCNESAGTCGGSCTPDCTGRECGSDGCGGTCGSCPTDRECNEGVCGCSFFSTLTYQLDGSNLSWDELFMVVVDVAHVELDGTVGRSENFCLGDRTGCSLVQEVHVYGCEPHLEITRTYHVLYGSSCTAGVERVQGQTSIVLPAPTIDGSSCTVPPL